MAITIKRPEQDVNFCPDGSLHAEYQQAIAELTRLRQKHLHDDRLNSPTTAQARRVVELEDEMRAGQVVFRMRGLARQDWRSLIEKHPPADGDDLDQQYGFAFQALTAEAIPACIVSVTQGGETIDFDPATEWEPLAAEMTDAQFEEFQIGAVAVNRLRQEVPFSQAAYKTIQDSEQT